jgi:hypothetical protein
MRKYWHLVLSLSMFVWVGSANAQKGSTGSASGASSSGGLPGLSYDQAHWPSDLTLPRIPESKRVLACYQISYANNTAQPFVLLPIHPQSSSTEREEAPFVYSCKSGANKNDDVKKKWCGVHPNGSWSPCSYLDEQHPIKMGQNLVIGIDMSPVAIERLKTLNINITTAQSNPINPTPVRPSLNNSGAGSVALGQDLYLTWPNPIPGDVIPTISLNVIYSPPISGELWSRKTFYPIGSIITLSSRSGHYYLAVGSGVSGDSEPNLPIAVPASVSDGDITWMDVGPVTSAAATKPPGSWLPNHSYNQGDMILDPYNGHLYISASSNGSKSGALVTDPFSLPTPAAGNLQLASVPQEVREGSVVWTLAAGAATCATGWQSNHPYVIGDIVGHYNGSCYEVVTEGTSGSHPVQPYFPSGSVAPVADNNTGANKLAWVDLGVIPPASVASALATDQIVNLLNLSLPQSHTLSYYNLASGVVYSTVHSRTFGIPAGVTNTLGEVQTSSSPNIDPVLLFTAYLRPADTEKHCTIFKCLWQTPPGMSFGLSLTSPASSFYAGGSLELLRNIQVVVGANWAKAAQLPKPPVAIASNATTATTVQKFGVGGFYGLTFNISGFIQGLFGGSKSSSSQ